MLKRLEAAGEAVSEISEKRDKAVCGGVRGEGRLLWSETWHDFLPSELCRTPYNRKSGFYIKEFYDQPFPRAIFGYLDRNG